MQCNQIKSYIKFVQKYHFLKKLLEMLRKFNIISYANNSLCVVPLAYIKCLSDIAVYRLYIPRSFRLNRINIKIPAYHHEKAFSFFVE